MSANFFIVGVAKSGTTSVYKVLKEHKDVFMSPLKEPNFFSSDINPNNFRKDYILSYISDNSLKKYLNSDMPDEVFLAYIRDVKDYEKLFKNSSTEKFLGEISTSYLYSKVAAKNIYKYNKASKIIIILRNPIERAFSHYLMDLRMGFVTGSFVNEIKKDFNSTNKGWGITNLYVELGLYYEQIKRYFDVFPKEQICIIYFDDLKSDGEIVYKKIFNFMSLEYDSFDFSILQKKQNQAKLPKAYLKRINFFLSRTGVKNLLVSSFGERIKSKIASFVYTDKSVPKLGIGDRKIMLPYFRDDIEKLQDLLGKDLSNWKNI